MNTNILDVFGDALMKNVRDESITSLFKIITGDIKAPFLRSLSNKIDEFSDEDKELIKTIIIESIDTCLFNLMLLFDENSDDFKIVVGNENDGGNLHDIEDELHGRLFCWYDDFSIYDYNI